LKFLELLTKAVWQLEVPFRHPVGQTCHVDLGAGNNPRNPFRAERLLVTDFHGAVGSSNGSNFIQCDLTRNLPFPDSSIDSFSAYDVLEHIPRWERVKDETGIEKIIFPFINLMNEIHRALKPGGLLYAVTPAFPSPASFQDPTHINFITVQTKDYFTGDTPIAKSLGYGFDGSFVEITQTWVRRHKGALGQNSDLLPSCLNGPGIYKYAFQPRNIRAMLSISARWFQRKPTHLLWVFQKPIG
jgi:SAM-dependent methyltransferase